jgi:hypothetical protein
MVAVTYGVGVSAPRNAEPLRASQPRKGVLVRLFEAMLEARLRQAHREIAQHAHTLRSKADKYGNRARPR